MTDKSNRASLFDLAGRTAFISGASSGIGEHFARVLAANGARVVVAARRRERLDGLCAEIAAAGGEALAVTMDATDEASTIAAFDSAQEHFGTIDTVIANAGIGHSGALAKVSVSEFDDVFAINVRGVFLTAREGMRRMKDADLQRRGAGRVILNASILGRTAGAGTAAYSASKAAVVQLGRSMAKEWVRRGINVNVLCPGYIRTELNADTFESDFGKQYVQSFARQRLMDIDALDGALLFLASEAGRFTTGAIIDIDDGQML